MHFELHLHAGEPSCTHFIIHPVVQFILLCIAYTRMVFVERRRSIKIYSHCNSEYLMYNFVILTNFDMALGLLPRLLQCVKF